MPAPQPIAAEFDFSNRLVDLMASTSPNEFELRRIESGIERLIERGQSDMATCYSALAMARTLRRDTDGALAAARNSAWLRPDDGLLQVNLLTTFLNLADIQSASALADRAFANARGNVRLLSAIASTYCCSFRFADAIRVAKEAGEAAEHVPGYENQFGTAALESFVRAREAAGYQEDELRELFLATVRVLREFDGIGPLRYTNIVTDDGPVVHYFHMAQSAEHCAELDWLIADRLAENFERSGVEVLSLSCLPFGAYFEMNRLAEEGHAE